MEATSGELVGGYGVDEWSEEDVTPFGYWLAPEAKGRGYATDASGWASAVRGATASAVERAAGNAVLYRGPLDELAPGVDVSDVFWS